MVRKMVKGGKEGTVLGIGTAQKMLGQERVVKGGKEGTGIEGVGREKRGDDIKWAANLKW